MRHLQRSPSCCCAVRLPRANARGNVAFARKPSPMNRYRRLTHPLVRDGGSLRRATWDEALDRAAAALYDARERDGTRTFGMFSCSKATNEVNFVAQKFARIAVGSNN